MAFIIAQILGVVALIITVCSFFTKNKNIFILFNLLFNIILSLQYLCLDKTISCFLCLFAAVRYIIYIFKGSNKFFSGIWIPISFIICNLTISIITFKYWFDILPAISAITLCITPWSSNIKVLKIGSISVCPLWFVYDLLVCAWTAAIMEVVTVSITLTIFIVQIIREKKSQNKSVKNMQTKIAVAN